MGVHQSDCTHEDEKWYEEDDSREHVTEQYGEKHEVSAREGETRERVGCWDRNDDRQNCRCGGDEKAVPEEPQKVLTDAVLRIEQLLVAGERRLVRPPLRGELHRGEA